MIPGMGGGLEWTMMVIFLTADGAGMPVLVLCGAAVMAEAMGAVRGAFRVFIIRHIPCRGLAGMGGMTGMAAMS